MGVVWSCYCPAVRYVAAADAVPSAASLAVDAQEASPGAVPSAASSVHAAVPGPVSAFPAPPSHVPAPFRSCSAIGANNEKMRGRELSDIIYASL